jgi:hypothetical protein
MEHWHMIFEQPDQRTSDPVVGLLVSGEIVLKSGIYRVEHAAGEQTAEAILLRGSRLPVCEECKEPLVFSLIKTVPHLSEDEDFAPTREIGEA